MSNETFVASLPRMAKRKDETTNLGIPKDVYALYDEWCERNSLIRRDVAGKLLKWFMAQEDALRKVVIGATSDGMEREYAAAVKRIADRIERRAKPDVGEIGTPKGQARTERGQLVGGPRK